MLKQFLKNDGENIVFTGDVLECYIPKFYFQGKLGEDYGSSLNVFGVFNARVINGNKPMKLETFSVPSMIYIYPSEKEEKDLQLIEGKDGTVESYVVVRFYKNNVIMRSSIPKDASNVELFLDILFKGKLPKTIEYSKILQIWQKNLELNGVKLGVTSAVLEIIISEICRDRNKPEQTFAKVIGKNPNISELLYRTANIREICARNSTFSALTFEDFDAMTVSSLNINNYGKSESESPIEKIIKM